MTFSVPFPCFSRGGGCRFTFPVHSSFVQILLAALLLAIPALGAEFRPLPSGFSVTAISGDGSTAVGSLNDSERTPARYFIESQTLQNLGDLTDFLSGAFGSVSVAATSANGKVIVGTISGADFNFNSFVDGFVWEESGPEGTPRLTYLFRQFETIDSDFISYPESGASGVSHDGQAVVGHVIDNRSFTRHGAIWTRSPNGNYASSLLPKTFGGNGLAVGEARAIAPTGTSVGNQRAFNGDQAVIFGSGELTSSASGFEPFQNTAHAISQDGTTIVGCSNQIAFRSFGFGTASLGDFLGGVNRSVALDVSGDGARVVGWGHNASGELAFLWEPNHGLRSIRDILVANGINMTGWILQRAVAISDDGQRIAGTGLFQGQFRSWLAILPHTPVITGTTTLFLEADGSPFSYQITASKNPTQYAASNLPPSLQINADTGIIEGTRPPPGQYKIGLSATNANGTTSAELTLNLGLKPQITSALAATGAVELPFSYQIAASNQPTSFSASNLPSGLSVSAQGLISGTPRESGVFAVTLRASNPFGTATAALQLEIGPPALDFISDTEAFGTVGIPFSFQVQAANGPAVYSASGLPSGLSINASGLISGTPTASGTFSVTCLATNAAGTGNYLLQLRLSHPASGLDLNNPERTLGHGLTAEILSSSASWRFASVSASVKIQNPSSKTSYSGYVEIRDKFGFLDERTFSPIPAGGSITININVSGLSTDDNRVYGVIYENGPNNTLLQGSFSLTRLFNYPSAPPSGGSTNPDTGLTDLEGIPLQFTGVLVSGAHRLNESTESVYSARGELSNGTTFAPTSLAWSASHFAIGTDGRFSAGAVNGNLNAFVNATITLNGVTKTGSKRVTVIDLSPKISITTATPLIRESDGDQGVFRLKRSGQIDTPVIVKLAASGTATKEDYEPLPTDVLFPPGFTEITISPALRRDSIFEPDETIVYSIVPDPENYSVVPPSSATITIQDSGRFRGVYNGLIEPSDQQQLLPRGLAKLALDAKGTITGSVVINGARFSFRSTLNASGATAPIALGKSEWRLALQLDLAGLSEQITGVLSDGATPAANLVADRALFTRKPSPVAPYLNVPIDLLNPASDRGNYTALAKVTAPPFAGGFPGGFGWTRINLKSDGSVVLAGKLPDGTPLKYANSLSRARALPIYLPLHQGKGFLSGMLQFDPSLAQTDTSGAFHWARPALKRDKVFPDGWPNGLAVTFEGSRFVAAQPATKKNPTPPFIAGVHNVFGLSAEDAPLPLTITLSQSPALALGNLATIDAKNRVTIGGASQGSTAADKLKLTLNAKTGAMSGSFVLPNARAATPFGGIVVQKSQTAAGTFLAKGELGSGAVTVETE